LGLKIEASPLHGMWLPFGGRQAGKYMPYMPGGKGDYYLKQQPPAAGRVKEQILSYANH
jgi:hypothetical protein